MANSVHSDSVNQLLLNTGLGAFDLRQDVNVSAKRRGASMNPQPGRAISQDFEIDLRLAAKRALGSFAELLDTARDTDLLFSSLDGLDAGDRYPHEQVILLKLVNDLVDPDTCVCFHAAVGTDASVQQTQTPTMDQMCACMIDPTLSNIYISTDLGFRDIFLVSQIGLATGLVLRAAKAGLQIDPGTAVAKIAALLGNQNTDTAEFDPTKMSWLSAGNGRQSAHVVAPHDAT